MLLIRLLLKLRGILAQSWWLSWCLYRLHRLPLVGPPEEEVWYFAYGANMHDSAFRGWRGMRPLDWRPGRVRGFRLRFNLEGRPRGKRPLWLDAEDINGHPFRAMTYIAHGKEVDSRPSLRYIMLLRDGARSHGLPEHYIRVLEDVEAAQ